MDEPEVLGLLALKELLKDLQTGFRERASPSEKDAIAKKIIEAGMVEQVIKFMTRSVTYTTMRERADEWAERLGVDKQAFVVAFRPGEKKKRRTNPKVKAKRKGPKAGGSAP